MADTAHSPVATASFLAARRPTCATCGNYQSEHDSPCLPVRKAGVAQMGEEVSYRWAIFAVPRTATQDERDAIVDEAMSCLGWFRRYGGPGRAFSEDPYVAHYAHAILIKQRCGLDI
jgi:hypothetical protein